MINKVYLDKPVGTYNFIVNGVSRRQGTNTACHKGRELLTQRTYPNYIIGSNNDSLRVARLSTLYSPITYESDKLSEEYSGFVATRESYDIQYLSYPEGRFANIHMKYTFSAAERTEYIFQVGIFNSISNKDMLFGHSFNEPILLEEGEVLTLVYSIYIPIYSSITPVGSGIFNDINYQMYLKLHEENSNELRTLWPTSFNDRDTYATTGNIARPAINGTRLENNMCRYYSYLDKYPDRYELNIRYMIFARNLGDINILSIDMGHYSNNVGDYTMRLVPETPVLKYAEEYLDIQLNIVTLWR